MAYQNHSGFSKPHVCQSPISPKVLTVSPEDAFSTENHCHSSDPCEECKVTGGESHIPQFTKSRNEGQGIIA